MGPDRSRPDEMDDSG